MPIKVLVVDDSTLARKLICDALAGDKGLEVVAAVRNGKLALERMKQDKVDIVTLDVEMPELDGIETLKAIRKLDAKLPVIMFSALTEQGAQQTFDALHFGANDYVTKPNSQTDFASSIVIVREELTAKIRALTKVSRIPVEHAPKKEIQVKAEVPMGPVDVVAVGVSTGGPNALSEFLAAFPANFSLPILITQHMPPMFTRMLAARLGEHCKLKVFEGEQGQEVLPGQVYIAPGGFHMKLEKRDKGVFIRLTEDPPENFCRPAVDVMFRSIVETYQSKVLAVILTGMGQDGLKGSTAIKSAGGYVVAQDEATSVVWGMPGAVAQHGVADAVVALPDIGPEIIKRIEASKNPPKRARVS